MKCYLAVEYCEGLKTFNDFLNKINFKGYMDPEDYNLDLEGNVLIEGFLEKNENVLELISEWCGENNTRMETLFLSIKEPALHYYRFGKSGKILSDKFPKEVVFGDIKKRSEMKTKLILSWGPPPVYNKGRVLNESYDYYNRISEEFLWVLESLFIKEFEVQL